MSTDRDSFVLVYVINQFGSFVKPVPFMYVAAVLLHLVQSDGCTEFVVRFGPTIYQVLLVLPVHYCCCRCSGGAVDVFVIVFLYMKL